MHCAFATSLDDASTQTIKIIDSAVSSTRGQLKYNLLKDRRHIVGRVCVLTMECLLGVASFVLISTIQHLVDLAASVPHRPFLSPRKPALETSPAHGVSAALRKRFRPTPHEIGLLKPDFV